MPEHPSTYFVDDRSSADDLTRLQIQDQMVTQAMGGVLPEQADPTRFQRVLDVGCGTGGWLLEAARTYPSMSMLVGIDISSRMVAFARQQAVAHHLNDRVTFQVMDALRMLEFPDRFFDLVNQRAGVSYLRTWEWPKVLQEYHRVTRPGGTVRISEGEWAPESNSPAILSRAEPCSRCGERFARGEAPFQRTGASLDEASPEKASSGHNQAKSQWKKASGRHSRKKGRKRKASTRPPPCYALRGTAQRDEQRTAGQVLIACPTPELLKWM